MEFKLPDIGEGVVEGELIQWLVKEGDSVTADQPILEVMTDKATVEIPSPINGKVANLKAKDGEMIKVGQTLAILEEGAGATAKPAAATPAAKAPPPVPSASSAASKAPPTPTPAPSRPAASAQSYSGGASLSPSDVPAAPIVRLMAQKAGVNLSEVPASGPDVGSQKRVLEEDLLKYLSGSTTPSNGNGQAHTSYSAPAAATTTKAPAPKTEAMPDYFKRAPNTRGEEVERTPVRGLRRVIAQAMVKSKYTAPHYSYVDEFECSSLVAIREEAKKIGEQYGVKISYLPFVVKALVGALKEFPVCNSSLEEKESGLELVKKKFYHIGIAVASPDGLVVPVIKNADQKSLLEIAREINELSAKVRAGKATSEELKGSTFTITSMGNVGGLFATPIINYPETGILGVYKVQEKPIVQNGQIVIGKTMHLSLSLDHRVIDGAVGGYFCNAIIERLQNPARLLLELA
jgi:pyruvate/2-oxoglutarate dehydrogenase complex dihydrolipoamide acyltransferase (E2) component